jgi:hypothetical protein
MKRMTRALMGILATLILAGGSASPGEGAEASRLERPGTVGLSLYGGYGWVTGESRYGLDFDTGWGLGVNIRYVLGPHWSLGLNFQNQSYDAVTAAQDVYKKFTVTDAVFDVYLYPNRTLDSAQYFVVGVGFYRPEVHRTDGTIQFPGENILLSGGLGMEVFIKENWGLDLSGRAYGYVGDGYADQEKSQTPCSETENVEPCFPGVDGDFSVGLVAQVGLIYYIMR